MARPSSLSILTSLESLLFSFSCVSFFFFSLYLRPPPPPPPPHTSTQTHAHTVYAAVCLSVSLSPSLSLSHTHTHIHTHTRTHARTLSQGTAMAAPKKKRFGEKSKRKVTSARLEIADRGAAGGRQSEGVGQLVPPSII